MESLLLEGMAILTLRLWIGFGDHFLCGPPPLVMCYPVSTGLVGFLVCMTALVGVVKGGVPAVFSPV